MPSSEAAPGRLPPGYELVRTLGHGGSGWVALARQTALDRDVAIKLVLTGTHDPAGLRRLEREGRVIVSLTHPRVVPAYALLPWQGGAALVMEFQPGGDLRGLIDAGPLTGAAATLVLSQVAEGLGHAHERGITHRDVKPENVLLTASGDAKIADFGLARLPRVAGAFRTAVDQRTGTPAYMAPEQITDPEAESPAIDAYAFAVLAYEILTGVRPFTGRDVGDLLRAHLRDRPAAPWEVRPGFPEQAGRDLLEGLAKHPADRPSVRDLARSLCSIPATDWDALLRRRPSAAPSEATTGADLTGGGTIAATSDNVFPAPVASADPMVILAVQEVRGISAVELPPVFRPPDEPFWHRRVVFLPVALLVGLLLGLVVAIVLES